jgi:hypothetical protein
VTTLTYVPTRQRDRYRVFDGGMFLGVVERPRIGSRRQGQLDCWQFTGQTWAQRVWSACRTRTEAAEALRQMRRQEAA